MNIVERNNFGLIFKVVEPDENTPFNYTPTQYTNNETALETWCKIIRSGDVVVDAGACFGSYSFPALAAGAKVIAYEPWSEAQKMLELNYSKNNFAQELVIRPFALWDNTPVPENLSQELWQFHYPNKYEVKTTTLDNDLLLIGVDRVDYIKFDIEGAELPALLGAGKTLESRPTLIIEDHDSVDLKYAVSSYPASVNSSNRIHELLRNLGYLIEVVPWVCNQKHIVARHPSRKV